jgi:hypothetical protein
MSARVSAPAYESPEASPHEIITLDMVWVTAPLPG